MMTRDELRALASSSGGPHASIYTHVDLQRPSWETRVRASIQRARRAWATDAARALDFAGLEQLLLACQPGRYVCALLGPDVVRVLELPEHVDDLVMTGTRFYLAPLMRFVCERRAWALCIGLGHNSLYEGDLFASRRLDEPPLPQRIEDVLGHELTRPNLQHHSARFAVFHGQGAGGGVEKTKEAEKFFRVVDDHVAALLPVRARPRVLIGLAQHTGLYTGLSKLDWTVAPSVDPTSLDDETRWNIAVATVRDHLLGGPDAALQRAETFIDDVAQALEAARDGRIETLFIERGARLFALVCDGNLVPSMQRTSERELVDRTAACALLHGSDVHVLPRAMMPTAQPVAAVMRY